MIYIQLVFVLILILEALHDKAVIELQDYRHYKYKELSSQWHAYSAFQYVVMVGIVQALSGWWPLSIILFLLRVSIFPLVLNVIRKKAPFYLSQTGSDGVMIKILGRHAGIILTTSSITIIVTLNIFFK